MQVLRTRATRAFARRQAAGNRTVDNGLAYSAAMNSVELASGRTAYELTGPTGGELVVLLHGGTVPMWTWDLQLPALVQAGYRVLRYDMLGKGESASPDARYDRALFKRQLAELLAALGWAQPLHMVGFSFGGATAVNFALQHADRIQSLALIAPMLHFARGNRIVQGARLPLVGSAFVRHVLLKKAADRARHLWRSAPYPALCRARFDAQLAQPGFGRAFVSYLRSDALDDHTAAYRQLGQGRLRPLLLWGSRDGDIPAAHVQTMRQLLPHAQYQELPGVRHGAPFEAADRVNTLLLQHLQAHAHAQPA